MVGGQPPPPHGSVCKLDKQPGCKPGAIGIGGSNPSWPTRCELVIRLRPRVRARCSTTLDEGTVPSPAFNRARGWFDSNPSTLRRVVEPLGLVEQPGCARHPVKVEVAGSNPVKTAWKEDRGSDRASGVSAHLPVTCLLGEIGDHARLRISYSGFESRGGRSAIPFRRGTNGGSPDC